MTTLALLLLAVAGLPWVIVLGRRWGYVAAIAAVVLVQFALVLAVMMVTVVARLPLAGTVIIVWLVAAIAGTVLCLRGGRRTLPPGRDWATWLPTLLGAAVWLGVIAASWIVPGASRLSWVMPGDSANNVLFAREVIYRQGIAVGVGENPVPLPSALQALAMVFGRDGTASAELLRHDVGAFATLWALLLALTCVTAGIAAAALARAAAARRLVVGLTGAIASLLPLSWFITGYPLEFGFFNTHVALPVVFATIVIYLESARRPAVSLAFLMLSGTLLLAVWSPLVLIPGALGLVVVLRNLRGLVATRGPGVGGLIIAGAQLLAYGLLIALPGLLAHGEALGADGGAITFGWRMLPAAAALTVILGVVAARGIALRPLLWGAVAVAGASVLGLLALLAAAWDGGLRWTYYPTKFAWLATVVMLVVIVGLLLPIVARLLPATKAVAAASVLLLGAVVGFATMAPLVDNGMRRQHPFVRNLTGTAWGVGDEAAERLFALSDLEHPRVLWNSKLPDEGQLNFWLLQMQADSLDENFDLRVAAYDIGQMTETAQLCGVIDLMREAAGPGVGIEVLTNDAGLDDAVMDECESPRVQVALLEARPPAGKHP